jgi:protein-serine/threonine kinase
VSEQVLPCGKIQHEQPTMIVRAQFKSRPSIISISIDRDLLEITPEVSPSTSVESSSGKSSAKSSIPRPGDSTGKTSFHSKFSTKSKGGSQHSSENKKLPKASKQMMTESGTNENQLLTPIAEVESFEAPEPVPSKCSFIVT